VENAADVAAAAEEEEEDDEVAPLTSKVSSVGFSEPASSVSTPAIPQKARAKVREENGCIL
jgi:hypothetical protein